VLIPLVGIGAIFSGAIYLWWDHYIDKAKVRNASWAHREDYRRLPLGCIGGPFFTVGMFWMGWTARSSIHWIVPVLGGFPLGAGMLLLFMSLINYLVDAYETFAASALAATACSRSLFGVLLPFAAKPMYDQLGVAWACSLLGFLSLAMCTIPFAFLKYGNKIRANSRFCQELAQQKRKLAEDEERKRAKYSRRAREAELLVEKAEVEV